MPDPSSTTTSVLSEGSVRTRIDLAPESSALATTSDRIVSSIASGYASRRSSSRCWRSTRVWPMAHEEYISRGQGGPTWSPRDTFARSPWRRRSRGRREVGGRRLGRGARRQHDHARARGDDADRARPSRRRLHRDLRRLQPRGRPARRGPPRRRLRRLPLAQLEVPLPHRRGRAGLRGGPRPRATRRSSRTAASSSTRTSARLGTRARTRRTRSRDPCAASPARCALPASRRP